MHDLSAEFCNAVESEILDHYAMAGRLDASEVLAEIRSAMNPEDRRFGFWRHSVAHYQAYLDGWRFPLHMAAGQGYVARVQAMLDAGADLEGRDDAGRTPLLRAVIAGEYDTMQALIAAGASVNARDSNRMTVMHWAAVAMMTSLHPFMVDLAAAGGDPWATDNSGECAMDLLYGPTYRADVEQAHLGYQARLLEQSTPTAGRSAARRL